MSMMILRLFSGLSPVSSSYCWMDEATGSGAGARGGARTDGERGAAMSGGGRAIYGAGCSAHPQYQSGAASPSSSHSSHVSFVIPTHFPWYHFWHMSHFAHMLFGLLLFIRFSFLWQTGQMHPCPFDSSISDSSDYFSSSSSSFRFLFLDITASKSRKVARDGVLISFGLRDDLRTKLLLFLLVLVLVVLNFHPYPLSCWHVRECVWFVCTICRMVNWMDLHESRLDLICGKWRWLVHSSFQFEICST